MTDDPARWLFEGRYYGISVCAGSEAVTVELDDLAPAPDRGTVAVATYPDDGSGPFVQSFGAALPLALVRQFLDEAARNRPPRAKYGPRSAPPQSRDYRAASGLSCDGRIAVDAGIRPVPCVDCWVQHSLVRRSRMDDHP